MPKRKTTEEFRKELFLSNPLLELVSEEYINSRTKLLFRCKKCGTEWTTVPYTLLTGHGCPTCGNEIAKSKTTKTNEKFLSELKEVNEFVEPLETYRNAQTYMTVRCRQCGHIWKSKPYLLLQKHGCPVCARKIGGEKISLSHEEFFVKAKEVAPEIEIIGKYIRSNVKLECRCITCGFRWFATPNSILRKHTGCRKCNRVYQTSFPEQAIYYYMLKNYPDAINGYRKGFKNTEIDIFIPSLNIGIEYDGAFFHTSKTVEKEKNKYSLCRKYGIRLIRVRFEITQDISDVTILSYAVKYDSSFAELDRVINLLFEAIGGDKPTINVEKDKNEIYKLYLKTKNEQSLSYNFPEIAKEWHPTYNDGILPNMVKCGTTSKFWWKCSKCDYEWEATVLSRTGQHTGCPKCANRITRTHEEFLDELIQINPNITPLENFKNTTTKLFCECLVCGHKWHASPIKLLNKRGCPVCAIENSKSSIEEIQKRITAKRKNIKILKFDGYNYQGEFECLTCGTRFSTISKTVIDGKFNCPQCSKTRRLSNEEFVAKLLKLNPSIIPLDEYKNMHTKIQVKCSICGNVWIVKPANLIHSKTGCPWCYKQRTYKHI